jgi:hypothetical protein
MSRGITGFIAAIIHFGTLVTPSGALAARQGELGPSSSGSIGISVTIAPTVRLIGGTDIALGDKISRNSETLIRSLCIISNSHQRVLGARVLWGAGLNDLAGHQGPEPTAYSVRLSSPDGRTLLGNQDEAMFSAAASSAECARGPGSLAVKISQWQPMPAEESKAAPAGIVTLLLAPS